MLGLVGRTGAAGLVVVGRCRRNRLQIWRNLSFTGTTSCFSLSGHPPIWEACGCRRDKSALKSRRTARQRLEIILLISGGRNCSFAPRDCSCFSEDSGQWFGRLLSDVRVLWTSWNARPWASDMQNLMLEGKGLCSLPGWRSRLIFGWK